MTRAKPLPSQEELRELFDYRDGKLYWKQRRGGSARIGSEAGWLRPDGYVDLRVHRSMYKRHRIIYALLIKDPGDFEIDHVNGQPGDDRIENLRLADRKQNMYNTRRYSNGKSGHKGVCWHRVTSRWVAQIRLPEGRVKHLGLFTSKDDAIAAYRQAALELHGEFARFT